jgi:hypothetical protein
MRSIADDWHCANHLDKSVKDVTLLHDRSTGKSNGSFVLKRLENSGAVLL